MNGTRLFQLLASALLAGSVALPAAARTSDAPAFGVWLAQWAQYGRRAGQERLPCLRANKAQCNGVLTTPRAMLKKSVRKKSVKAVKHKRYKVAAKKTKRVNASHAASQTVGAFSYANGALLLTDAGQAWPLTIDARAATGDVQQDAAQALPQDDSPPSDDVANGDNPALDVPTLDAFLADAGAPPDTPSPMVPEVAAGVGNNAYGALYDFEDEGGAGENQRGFQEVSSLLGAQTLLASASDVPEPGTVLLVGGALLVMRLKSQRRSHSGTLLPGAL